MDEIHCIAPAYFFAFVIALLCVGVIVTYPVFDYDLHWRLANGREMLAQHRIINEEVFRFRALVFLSVTMNGSAAEKF